MALQVQPRPVRKNGRTSIEIDPNFLKSGLVRTVHRVEPGPPTGEPLPHKHDYSHILIPLAGNGVWLAFENEKGEIVRIRLEVGNMYTIEPMVPHQWLATEGIVESFLLPSSLLAPDKRPIPVSKQFFDQDFLNELEGRSE